MQHLRSLPVKLSQPVRWAPFSWCQMSGCSALRCMNVWMGYAPSLELLKTEVQRQLEPQRTSTFAWFLAGGAPPPPLSSPPHVAPRLCPTYHSNLTPRHQTAVASPPTVPHSGYAAQHTAVSPSPSTPSPSGLLPPEGDKHQHVVRVRGLRHVHDTNQVSSVITHFLATPVTVSARDMGKGHKYVFVSRLTVQMLFAQAPVRHYVDPDHSYKLDIESKQASGDPFHMPLDSPEPLPTKLKGSKSKRPNKTDKAEKKHRRTTSHPTPRHPMRGARAPQFQASLCARTTGPRGASIL